MTASARSFFVGKKRKTYGCEMPARRAMSAVVAPAKPLSAISSTAAVEDRLAPLGGSHAVGGLRHGRHAST